MVITYNEALNLPHCLRSLQGWTRKVFVIDSGSTDGTPDLARSFGAEVVHHAWEGYARQKNWGLRNMPFESDWILILDADEVIPEKVRDRLVEIARKPAETVRENGFFINRLTIFLGRPIRHCGYFPSWNMRFFKRGRAHYEDREVHEHMIVDDPVGYIREPMLHDDRRGLEHYVAKHNRYSTLEARAIFQEIRDPAGAARLAPNLTSETRRRRWLKRYIMPYVPMPSLWRFLYMYVLRAGILDGRAGLEFSRFISVYDYLVALKLRDLRRQAKRGAPAARDASVPAPARGLALQEGDLAGSAVLSRPVHPASPAPSASVATSVPASTAGGTPVERGARAVAPEQLRPESSPWTFREKVYRAIWMLVGKPLFRFSFHNWYGFRAWLLRMFGARIGKGVRIRPTVNVEIPWNLDIREEVTIGDHAILYSLGTITIDVRTIVSQYAHLCAGTHDHRDRRFPLIRDPIYVGPDSWIGADAFVGPRVSIGRLSVLGARSSAYKDLDEQTVYVGNPCRPLKKRELR